MAVTIARERWTNKIAEVTIGTEPNAIKVGGDGTLPFLHFEGEMPNPPKIALEILDMEPQDWPAPLVEAYGGVMGDPVAWAKKCAEFGPDALAISLVSAHPDNKNASPEEVAATVKAVADAVPLPLIILGCGNEDRDVEIFPAVAEAVSGRNFLLGPATAQNYKTIVAACMVHGHNVIAQSPLDINLAKQLNILITEMAMAPSRILMDVSTASLGYGLEYCYSIMERARLGALAGDKMLAMPIALLVGQEAWKTKEAKTESNAEWGDQYRRGLLWEVVTSVALAQAGGALFVLRHPESLKHLRAHLEVMMRPNTY